MDNFALGPVWLSRSRPLSHSCVEIAWPTRRQVLEDDAHRRCTSAFALRCTHQRPVCSFKNRMAPAAHRRCTDAFALRCMHQRRSGLFISTSVRWLADVGPAGRPVATVYASTSVRFCGLVDVGPVWRHQRRSGLAGINVGPVSRINVGPVWRRPHPQLQVPAVHTGAFAQLAGSVIGASPVQVIV